MHLVYHRCLQPTYTFHAKISHVSEGGTKWQKECERVHLFVQVLRVPAQIYGSLAESVNTYVHMSICVHMGSTVCLPVCVWGGGVCGCVSVCVSV